MKTLELVFEVPELTYPPGEQEKTAQELVWNFIQQMVQSYAASKQSGLDIKERRLYYKLMDVFEPIENSNGAGYPESIELEDAHFEFIKKVQQGASFLPTKLSRSVEDLIDKAGEKKDDG